MTYSISLSKTILPTDYLSTITKEEIKAKTNKLANHYGLYHQAGVKLKEETLELHNECEKYLAHPTDENLQHLLEEAADVQVLLDQILSLLPEIVTHRLHKYKNYKCDRQLKRIIDAKTISNE